MASIGIDNIHASYQANSKQPSREPLAPSAKGMSKDLAAEAEKFWKAC